MAQYFFIHNPDTSISSSNIPLKCQPVVGFVLDVKVFPVSFLESSVANLTVELSSGKGLWHADPRWCNPNDIGKMFLILRRIVGRTRRNSFACSRHIRLVWNRFAFNSYLQSLRLVALLCRFSQGTWEASGKENPFSTEFHCLAPSQSHIFLPLTLKENVPGFVARIFASGRR